MSVQVDHCPNCGSVYRKNFRNICSDCSAAQDTYLSRCLDYLWKYPDAATEEVSRMAEVPLASLHSFIKEGRISRFYRKLTYPCECCGAPVRERRLCGSCSAPLQEIARQLQSRVIPLQPGNGYIMNNRRK
ncbi:flagellar protein [Paenibacillus sp. GCM10012303]|uniref:flagellar protein n=1 Tax=Paenibacillus sp. GCM10012303 TaxID=3317340 RepID=UPI003615EDA6